MNHQKALYRDEIANVVEPSLKAIFDDLNSRFFNGELPSPDSLAWDYRPAQNRGGQISYSHNTGHCYYIVVRGKQQGNAKNVEQIMLHEMVHLSLVVQFFRSDLPTLKYRVRDFVADKTAPFILATAKAATKYGCTYNDLASWDMDEYKDKDTTLTSKKYSEIQSGRSLLATLKQDN